MELNSCTVCGIGFVPSKYNKDTTVYCSYCRAVVHRKKSRDSMKRSRKRINGGRGNENSISKNGTSELSDLSIITVNGQERVKGMVTLERLINKMKGDKSSLYESEHF